MIISELDTPALIVDLDVMERNLSQMADYCRRHDLRLRPHTKTHKVPELARKQIESGAHGITVAKLDEAEVMVDAGLTDLLLAYPIVGPAKTARLARLAERATITVSLDSETAARGISAAVSERGGKVSILVELDVGFGRCGVADETQALNLAQTVASLPGLEFQGLMFFPGHFGVQPDERALLRARVNELLDRCSETFARAGVPVKTLSGGSTPSRYESELFHGVNEVRPGTYIFNDRNTVGVSAASLDDCALSVVVTVVSTGVAGHAVIDGGSKTFSSDRYQAEHGRGFGLLKEDHAAEIERLSEEHGHVNIQRSERTYRVGDRLTVIPNHVCSTVNMHDEIYGVRGDRVETVWRVAARGKVH
ncbi:MAG TPA: alanine racemase [Pyrinomonadaceae bacterium]|jgi:D-serine deaminase-like pyridoxal phosphate-dependent protein